MKPFRLKPFNPTRIEVVKGLATHRIGGVMFGVDLVNVTISLRGRNRTFPMIEKTFPGYALPLLVQETSATLRKAGVNAVGVRLMRTTDGFRCFMTDISRGGKFKVLEYSDRGDKPTIEAQSVSNFDEIQQSIRMQTQRASKAGYRLDPKTWLIAVDPATNRGKAYAADLKRAEKTE